MQKSALVYMFPVLTGGPGAGALAARPHGALPVPACAAANQGDPTTGPPAAGSPASRAPRCTLCPSIWALAAHLLARQRRPQVQRRQQTGALPAAAGGPGRPLSPRMRARPPRRRMHRMLMYCCHGASFRALGLYDFLCISMQWEDDEAGMWGCKF